MPTLEERVTALEEELHDYTTWCVYYDTSDHKYKPYRISFCKHYGITPEPGEYFKYEDAKRAADQMN